MLRIILLFVVACLVILRGLQMLIYGDRLGPSDFYYSYTSSNNASIDQKLHDGSLKSAVEENVIYYMLDQPYVIAVRQVVNVYMCDENRLTNEVLNKLEYWVINIQHSNVTGPLTLDEYEEMVLNGVPKLDKTTDEIVGYMISTNEIRNCTNPRFVG